MNQSHSQLVPIANHPNADEVSEQWYMAQGDS